MEFDFEDEKDSTAVKLNQLRAPKNLSVIFDFIKLG